MSAHVHPRDRGFEEWEECCVAHRDESPGGCVHCMVCHQWVRPHRFAEECLGAPNPHDHTHEFAGPGTPFCALCGRALEQGACPTESCLEHRFTKLEARVRALEQGGPCHGYQGEVVTQDPSLFEFSAGGDPARRG